VTPHDLLGRGGGWSPVGKASRRLKHTRAVAIFASDMICRREIHFQKASASGKISPHAQSLSVMGLWVDVGQPHANAHKSISLQSRTSIALKGNTLALKGNTHDGKPLDEVKMEDSHQEPLAP
jgi:hypothetical protein